MKFRIDLHVHSNLSDGVLSPKEIIDLAVQNGVSVLSITDHDTFSSYNEELFEYASKRNIKLITGVEISTKTNRNGIHVLGYNIDYNNKELINKLVLLKNARHNYLFNVSNKLNDLGYTLNTHELDCIDVVTKAHIALDVINNPLNRDKLIMEFGHLPSKGEFIETIMNEGCPAYVKKETINPVEAANLIRNAGGKVILAHPVAYSYEDNMSDEEIINLAKDMKVDGIEAFYLYVDMNNHLINNIDKWNNVAINNHWIVTMGTDFHNKDGIHPEIGFINYNLDYSEENLKIIISNLS